MKILYKITTQLDGTKKKFYREIDLETAVVESLDNMAICLRTDIRALGIDDFDIKNYRDREEVPITPEKEQLVIEYFSLRNRHEAKKALIKSATTPEEVISIEWNDDGQ